jgi:ferredoxin--NADP+ reductase
MSVEDVGVDELLKRYDAVVYALGAHADRTLRIPGEDLQGGVSATAFVNGYNGRPSGYGPRESSQK